MIRGEENQGETHLLQLIPGSQSLDDVHDGQEQTYQCLGVPGRIGAGGRT